MRHAMQSTTAGVRGRALVCAILYGLVGAEPYALLVHVTRRIAGYAHRAPSTTTPETP